MTSAAERWAWGAAIFALAVLFAMSALVLAVLTGWRP